MIKNHINHTFWCLNDDSGDTGGLWKDIQFGVTTGTDGKINAKTTINWDEKKYETYYYPAIWKTESTKKFIGLDHQVALGKNGISLSEYYASGESSNLDGGSKGNKGSKVDITVPSNTETTKPTSETTTTTTTVTTVTTSETTKPTTTSSESTSTARQVKWGDANEDGVVDVSDAVLVSRFVAEDTEANITAQGKLNANVAGGESINSDCTLKILKYIAKLITEEELKPQK